MNRVIVALGGDPNSGKSSVSNHLVDNYGFTAVRPSNLVRQFAAEQDVPLRERQDYIRAYLRMISAHGDSYVSDMVLATPSDRLVVDGERIPSNIDRLRDHGAVVIALACPYRIRYARALTRGASRDKTSLLSFLADEAREYRSTEPPYPSTHAIMDMADYSVDTSGAQADVLQDIDNLIEPLLSPQTR